MSLKVVADKLGELMGKPVTFLSDCSGPEVEAACADRAEGCPGAKCEAKGFKCGKLTATAEETAAFGGSLAKLGDVYVNDAFGTAHRGHASMVAMKGLMPCVAGLLVAKELDAFPQ
eukprot:218277-Heterocapsa_arctica.AAC.1